MLGSQDLWGQSFIMEGRLPVPDALVRMSHQHGQDRLRATAQHNIVKLCTALSHRLLPLIAMQRRSTLIRPPCGLTVNKRLSSNKPSSASWTADGVLSSTCAAS